MKISKKNLVSVIVLTGMLSFSIFANAAVPDTRGHWAAAQIEKWVNNGIINGYPDGTFRPNSTITRAEFASIASKLFNYVDKAGTDFTDVSNTAWYSDAVKKAYAAGIIAGFNGKFNPNNKITRQEAAIILAKAFKLTPQDDNTSDYFNDAGKISSWSKGYINVIISNGYMSGRPGNILAPTDYITRAETVALINKISGAYINTSGEYTTDIPDNLVITSPDVTLRNITIEGDLILAQGIGDGAVTLDGVHISGRTVVLGGGEDSIAINNSSLIGKLVVDKKDGKVGIVMQGTSSAADVLLQSGSKLVEQGMGMGFGSIEIAAANEKSISLEGNFEQINIDGNNLQLNIPHGTINDLTVGRSAANINVQLGETAEIITLQADAASTFSGAGTIMLANISANNVVIENPPGAVNIVEGVTATVAGEQVSSSTGFPAGAEDSGSTDIAVNSINIISESTTVGIGGTLQLNSSVLPSNATDKTVTWSVANGTGSAAISENGLLTATKAGTVTVIAVNEISSADR